VIKLLVATISVVIFIAIGVFYFCRYRTGEEALPIDAPETSSSALPAVTPEPEEPVTLPGEAPGKLSSRILGTGLSFEQKVEALKQIINEVSATGQRQEVRLVFSEEEANRQAAAMLSGTEINEDIPLEITSIKVYFIDDNRVLAEVKTVLPPFKPTVRVEIAVGVRDREPEVEVTRLGFGWLPLTGSVKEQMTLAIQRQIDEIVSRYGGAYAGNADGVLVELNDIKVRQGEVSVDITVRRN